MKKSKVSTKPKSKATTSSKGKKTANPEKDVKTRGAKSSPKSAATRKKILDASKKVFGEHPYHSASIRMIGKEAGIEHPLINYYYPSKSDLFEAVVSELEGFRLKNNIEWLKEISTMPVERSLSVYMDKFLDYHYKNPDVFRVYALNYAQPRLEEQIPASKTIQAVFERDLDAMMEYTNIPAPRHEVEMFSFNMSTLLISYLGAANSHAQRLNMDPNSIQYLNWIKETILYTFLPLLKKMFADYPKKT